MRWPIGCGRSAVLATVLAVSTAAGCTKSNDQVAAQVLADPAVAAMLRKIPADTPYAFVSFGGSSRAMVEKIYKGMGPLVERIGPMIDSVPLTGESAPLLRALITEFKGMVADGGIDRTGVDVDGRFALYGIGGLPAIRWSLKDPQALRDMLGRIQQSGGVQIPICKLGEAEYWCGGSDKLKIAAAIVSDELVLGVAPAVLSDRVFEMLFGKTAPERSLADSPKLKDLMGAWGLGRISVGFIDARVITEALLGEGDPLNKDVLAALAPDLANKWPQITPVCKDEMRALVAIAPMLVFGAESMGAEGFESMFAIELRSDVAQDLRALRAPVPGLSTELRQQAMFAMGAGADVGKAIALAMRKAQEVLNSPYQCPELADLNRAAEELSKGAAESVPKWVPGLRGGSLVLNDVKLSGFLPTSIDAHLVLATTDPRGLYEAIRESTPLAATYEFSDDGKVKTLPDGTVPFVNGIAYGAQEGRGFALAIGAGSEATVGKLLAAPEVKDPPLMLFAYDLGRMMQGLEPLMALAGQPELTAMLDVYKMFGPSGYEMYAEDRGLVFKMGMALK